MDLFAAELTDEERSNENWNFYPAIQNEQGDEE